MGFAYLLFCLVVACGGSKEVSTDRSVEDDSPDFELFIKKMEARHSLPSCDLVDVPAGSASVRISQVLQSEQLARCASVAKSKEKDIDLATRRFLAGYRDFREWPSEGGFEGLQESVVAACLPLSDLVLQVKPEKCRETGTSLLWDLDTRLAFE
ncbi:MAG: hypothetical protein HN348_33240, partial [Proteobacteria bacterium]|nr:hypothetical protein [Pseudomonadota bacterium]